MGIFPRRVINRILNENRKFLPAQVINDHIIKLNILKPAKACIAVEWEVVIINALSKIGSVEYEKDFGGSRKPDIFFNSERIEPFLSDITVVSDEGYHDANPVRYFREELIRYLKNNKVPVNRINIEIGGKIEGEYGDEKVKLSLPSKGKIPQFVKKEFGKFAELIQSHPIKRYSIEIPDGDSYIKVLYNPSQQFSGMTYLSYNVPRSLKKNPIYKHLEDKANQLKESGYKGVRGVFLCDGGCNALKTEFKGTNEYTVCSIIERIFREYSTLSFIGTLAVKEKYQTFPMHHYKYIELTLYGNRRAEYPISDGFRNELNKIINFLPIPEVTPVNALSEIVFKQKYKRDKEFKRYEGHSFLGGGSMSSNEIKIPSRMLTDILAGLTNYKELENKEVFGKNRENWVRNFFQRQRFEGKMIEEISIEKCPDKDDDWIIIKYGQIDASISKYR